MNQTLNEIGKEIIEDFKKYETGEKWGDLDQWLSKALAKHATAIRKEVAEEILGYLEACLVSAEQDKEMADNPDDPKVRINYFRDVILNGIRQRYLGGEEEGK